MGLDDNPALKRADLSTFIFHLTKDSRDESFEGVLEGRPVTLSARQNLLTILKERAIKAKGFHSLFKSDLKSSVTAVQDAFKVVCLSEAPLVVVDELVVPMRKGNIPLKPYGVIFTRECVVRFGANEAFYIGSDTLKDAEWTRYRTWKSSAPRPSPGTLPLVNLLNEKYDFTWEREWRFIGDFVFRSLEFMKGVVLPAQDESDLVQLFHRHDVPVIHPGMTQEQIDDEMRRKGPTDPVALHGEIMAL